MHILHSVCNTIINVGGKDMAFQLKQDKKESENKTIRFPVPLIQKIEAAIQNQEVSFSSFVIQACEYALHDMDKADSSKQRKTDKQYSDDYTV